MKKLYILVIAMLIGNIVNAQWQQTNGPYGGYIYSLATNGSNLYAGTYGGGVFLSTNNGTTWSAINNGLSSLNIYSLKVSGTNIYAGTGGAGVFLSTNNGANWTAINNGLTNLNIMSIEVCGTNIFAGTYEGGIYTSANNGTSWSVVNTGLTNTTVRCLAVNGANIYAGTDGGVFLSSNNGVSWSVVNTGLTNISIFSIAISGTNIFAGTGNGVFLSSNNGANWTPVNTGLQNTWVISIVSSGSDLIAGTANGIFLSANNGGNWTAVNSGLSNKTINSLAIIGTTVFAGTGGAGVFRSTNNGTNWIDLNTGIIPVTIKSLLTNGNNIFVGTYNCGIFLSTNNGGDWSSVNTGITSYDIISTLALKGSAIFAGTSGGVFLSTNNGSSWTQVNNGLSNLNIMSLAIKDSLIYAGTSGGIFLSSDNGTNWTSVNTGIPASSQVLSIAIKDTNIFASVWVTVGSGIYKSSNNGASWTKIINGLTNLHVNSIAVKDTNILAATQGGGVFLSSNNGGLWTPVNSGLTNTTVMSLAVRDSNIYAGTQSGVFLSTNNGSSWNTTGLINIASYAITLGGSNIFAATNRGVWKNAIGSGFPPSNQASAFKSSVITNSSMTIGWTRGNGDSVIVVARAGSAVNSDPVSGMSYFASNTFGNGSQLGNGNYVVYNGTDTLVNLTGLTTNTTYYFSIYEYKANNHCYLTLPLTAYVNSLNYLPVNITTQAAVIQTSCTYSTNVSFSITTSGTNPITYQWQYKNAGVWSNLTNGTPSGANYINGTTSAMSVSGISIASTYQYRCIVSNCIGIYSDTSNIASLTVNESPSVNTIASQTICSGGITTSINPTSTPPGASFIWTANASYGITGYIASGTNTIPAQVINNSTTSQGNVTYTITPTINSCTGYNNTFNVIINSFPSAAGAITGSVVVCQGQNNIIYTVPYISNATSYIWTLPGGATGTSTTNTINVNYGSSAISGNITVKGSNSCGYGVLSSLSVAVNPLSLNAGLISGITNICRGQNSVIYTVPSIANATSYIWTLPVGATGTSTTNTINVNYGTSAVSGNITVKGSNSCGYGTSSSLAVTVSDIPANAGSITGISSVCQGNNSVIYTVPVISNATTYVWTLPGGVTGTSTTNTMVASFGTSSISGNISVYGTNSCGNGNTSSKPITVFPLPSAAGVISGATIVCQGQNAVIYSVPIIPNASSYNWILPNGAAGTSITDSITIDFSNSSASGNISVNGVGSCGIGITSNLVITVNPLPSSAGSISGSTNVIEGQQNVQYSVPVIANATFYSWTLPNGVIGSSTTNSISLNYSLTAISGNIIVKGNNACGVGDSSTLYVTVNPFVPNCSAQFDMVADTAVLHHYFIVSNASGVPPLHYNWSWGDGTHDTIALPTHTYSSAGYYNICLSIIDSLGCSVTYCDSSFLQKSPDAIISVTVIPQGSLGIQMNVISDKIKIYPNPATDKLIIDLQQLKNLQNTTLSIYDIQGKLLLQQEINQQQTELNISSFAKGFYVVKVRNDLDRMVSKFVKE